MPYQGFHVYRVILKLNLFIMINGMILSVKFVVVKIHFNNTYVITVVKGIIKGV